MTQWNLLISEMRSQKESILDDSKVLARDHRAELPPSKMEKPVGRKPGVCLGHVTCEMSTRYVTGV